MSSDPLKPTDLYRACDVDQLGFETTSELEDLPDLIGQERALDAINFGIDVDREGYNVFVLGPSGHGKVTMVRQTLEARAEEIPVSDDWCYVYNFDQPHRPIALQLPPGRGCELRQEMDELIAELRTAIPAAFEGEQYAARRQRIDDDFNRRKEKAFEEIGKTAESRHIAMSRTPLGFAFVPTKDGKPLSAEEFGNLPEVERSQIQLVISQLQEELEKALKNVSEWGRDRRHKINDLNREITTFAVGHLIDDIRRRFADQADVLTYLDAVQADVIDNIDDFRPDTEEGEVGHGGEHVLTSPYRRYRVNVLVDHSEANGLPIVHETNPTYQNLIGRVEHFAHMGTLVTDFLLIKAGALHRANGGYLVLDARKVLMQQFAWDALKRALSNREIRIESIGEMMSMVSTISLAPFPIPLNIKVILTGDRQLYYMLYQLDPEFSELFRVAADIEDRLDRTPENDLFYARFIATLVSKEGLPPFDKTGVARIVEYGSRMAGDAERLSTHFRNIADLLVEAAHWAGRDGREIVTSTDVQLAIDEQVRRADRLRDRSHEAIERGTVLVDTDGEQVGQINGLSVLGIANFAFGQPSRITATVRLGEGELIDIEREADLGGSLHSKGVLILSQFLAARYAADEPLSLRASLAFEQSYAGVDGDSASLAELCALLSALSGVPIKQSFAVTGSVNQRGQVQAIGGVNEKIEGFFDVCLRCEGIDGRAVIIPESNRTHLMLRHDIVDAVRDDRFSVFAISSVDEAMELLTGLTAGVRDSEGIFPEGSVNRLVEDRLVRMAHRRRIFSKGGETEDS